MSFPPFFKLKNQLQMAFSVFSCKRPNHELSACASDKNVFPEKTRNLRFKPTFGVGALVYRKFGSFWRFSSPVDHFKSSHKASCSSTLISLIFSKCSTTISRHPFLPPMISVLRLMYPKA